MKVPKLEDFVIQCPKCGLIYHVFKQNKNSWIVLDLFQDNLGGQTKRPMQNEHGYEHLRTARTGLTLENFSEPKFKCENEIYLLDYEDENKPYDKNKIYSAICGQEIEF